MNKFSTIRKFQITGALAALIIALQAFSPLWADNTTPAKRPAEADKVHVVLLMAGQASDIGNADQQDIAAMKLAINAAFAKDQNRVVFHDLTGINPKTSTYFSGDEILDYLKDMKIGQNDNVLVYHSGHGGILDKNRPEESQVLCCDGGNVMRIDIRKVLSAKNPRALMILTDCCSSYPRGATANAAERATVNVATVRSLLLTTVGLVNITAAEDGTYARAAYVGANPGQAGSAFTVALMRLWYQQDVTFTSWETMFPTLRTETDAASCGVHRARAFQINTQIVAVDCRETCRKN